MRFEVPLEKKVKELSKGMKMKLSIATALSHGSKLLILDEATSGLDPIVRNEILDIFREFIEDEQVDEREQARPEVHAHKALKAG